MSDPRKPPITLDRTVRVSAPKLAAEDRPWCLVVVSGPNLGERYELGQSATIGRDARADIRLADKSVSRSHCRLWRKRGGYYVSDLGATNTTQVNGQPVDESPLADGDLITVGELVLKLLGPASPDNALVAALHAQATSDPLTGLANRRPFLVALERAFAACQRGQALSLLAVDIDHFKQINDGFGHPAGDRVLVEVAGVLRRRLRGSDLAGRIGGEEFAVLLPQSDLEAAFAIAEELRRGIEALQLSEADRRIPVTASVGVAQANEADATPQAVYARADAALYEAKQGGRNRSARAR